MKPQPDRSSVTRRSGAASKERSAGRPDMAFRRFGAGGQQHMEGPIEVRVERIGQLFHTLDPLPFRERDLDADVEEYVVGWAGEIARNHPISIVIHMPAAEAQRDEAQHIETAIRNYFAYRADVLGWDLRDLFRTGRASLAIGVSVLAACIVVGKAAGGLLGAGYVGRFFDEGLIILGWVANWRPVQIFLYDWWPLVRRRRLYRRLSKVPVEIVADELR
jgi:hypothetical protein